MDNIKIVFFDIDGTLINLGAKDLSEKTRYTLNRLRQNGIRVCIATGRPPLTVPRFEGVEFDAYLTFNGSYCYDKSGVIFSNPIPSVDVQKIIDNACAMGRPVSIATRERLDANGSDTDLEDYYSFVHMQVPVDARFEVTAKQDVYQIMMGCRKEEYAQVMGGVSGAKITAWWERAVDIIPANGGKGVGVEKILAHFGLSVSEALAFGDGNNDLEMLETVGTGVAMGNASEELKAVANDICGHVAEDGIYHYCLAHGLI